MLFAYALARRKKNARELQMQTIKRWPKKIPTAEKRNVAKSLSMSRLTICFAYIFQVCEFVVFWCLRQLLLEFQQSKQKNSDEELSDLTDGIRPMKFRNEHVHGAPFKSNSSVDLQNSYNRSLFLSFFCSFALFIYLSIHHVLSMRHIYALLNVSF